MSYTKTGMLDYSDFVMHSDCAAFKNNNVYTGSFTISGTISGGSNTITKDVALDKTPDMLDVRVTGRAVSPMLRQTGEYFKPGQGLIAVPANSLGETYWYISYSMINGTTLRITASYGNQTTSSDTISSAQTVNYKIIDYSAT